MTREIYTHVTAPMFDAAANAISGAVTDTFGPNTDANESADPAIGSNNGSSADDTPARGDDSLPATSR